MKDSEYVLDASVAAKWFLPPDGEALVETAVDIFDRFAEGSVRLIVPDLFWPEIGSIFWKAARAGRVSQQVAQDAIQSLVQLRIPTLPSVPLMGNAFSIAVTFGRSFYDSVYVALAVVYGAVLLTADERLVNSLGSRFPIRWLGAVA